jgi:peptide/nickel transport system substrate-binding protein
MTQRSPIIARRRSPSRPLAVACAVTAAVALGACGSSKSDSSGDSSSTPAAGLTSAGFDAAVPVPGQKKGGTLKLLSTESFEHLDPGAAYFQLDFMIMFAAHRSLYYFKPEDPKHPTPDLADGEPQVSPDEQTVTVKIKHGIKYGTNDTSLPVNGQEVKAADVKYAIERGFNPSVANGYAPTYFKTIVGADKAKGGNIAGITTPDPYTIQFKLDRPIGATLAKALVMAITMPVPKSYAAKFDAKQPNEYDAHPDRQAFSGPYMIKTSVPGKSLVLVRNPNWDPATDDRPAYLDQIEWTLGTDPNVSGRQILNGTGIVNGDTPAASSIKSFATKAKDQISFSPLGNRFVNLNTQKKPFSDLNARKAVAAALDRKAMQLTRGGSLTGDVATHFLPPTMAGFEEAGGAAGTGADYLANPSGDMALAQSYMKKAGYSSGRYDGPAIRMLGDNSSPAKETSAVVRRALESLGFKVNVTSVEHSAFYSKFCNVVSQLKKIDVCANYGWLPDFADPYAMLNANFNGESIVPVNNSNASLFDNKKINADMDKAAQIAEDAPRAKAWGAVDRELVEQVAAVPWFWDKTPNIRAKDVHGVIAEWNAAWDLSYMSRK